MQMLFIYLLNIYTGRIYNISIECKFTYERIYTYTHTSVKSTATNVLPVKQKLVKVKLVKCLKTL